MFRPGGRRRIGEPPAPAGAPDAPRLGQIFAVGVRSAPMSTPRIRLGQLLVDARMISQDALDEVLGLQRTDGRRLGTLLVEQGHINEIQLTQILSHQLAVPWVSLLHIEFSRQLLDLVPRDAAEKYCLVPIYVRHVRRQGDTLYVAMDDPTNEDALRECSSYSGLPVRAMIAPPSDIRDAIRVYYGASVRPAAAPVSSHPPSTLPDLSGVAAATAMRDAPEIAIAEEEADAYLTAAELEEATSRPTLESIPSDELIEASRSEPPTEAAEPTAEPESGVREVPELGMPAPHAEDAPPTRPAGSPGLRPPMAALLGAVLGAPPPASPVSVEAEPDAAARITPVPESDGVPSARIPAPRGRVRRMISLTLLDGTTINLPARGRRGAADEPAGEPVAVEPAPESEDPTLTARDLVAALRAVAHGADASEVLGNNVRWEAMFAALLSLLLRKRLIADWEFVEELKKI